MLADDVPGIIAKRITAGVIKFCPRTRFDAVFYLVLLHRRVHQGLLERQDRELPTVRFGPGRQLGGHRVDRRRIREIPCEDPPVPDEASYHRGEFLTGGLVGVDAIQPQLAILLREPISCPHRPK